MVDLNASGLDIFGLVDVDTDEAHAFTTYLGYWGCLAEKLSSEYGADTYLAIVEDLRSRKGFRALAGKGKTNNSTEIRSLLLNAWMSELRLNLIAEDDTRLLAIANHGVPVDAYYATTRAATAWLWARDSAAPATHRGLLNAVSNLINTSTIIPSPWNHVCSAVKPSPTYGGFASTPGQCSNLSLGADADAKLAMLLRTTRDREVRRRIEELKRTRKLARAPHGEARRQDQALQPTTIFDFAWRSRTRSNYGDPAMFYMGSLDYERNRRFAASVRTWTRATMFLFEALVAQRAQSVVRDAAVHFVSRDRSGLADAILVPRLETLGLLKPG